MLLFEYTGIFNHEIVIRLSTFLQSPSDIWQFKRATKCFIELADNVRKYSCQQVILSDKKLGNYGSVKIELNDGIYRMTSVNPISDEDADMFKKRIIAIETCHSTADLKDLRREYRNKDIKINSGNIGLITLAIFSKDHKIEYAIDRKENYKELTLSVDI